MGAVNYSELEVASRRLADLQETEAYWNGQTGRCVISYQGQQQLVQRRKEIEESILAAVCSTLVAFIRDTK